MRHEVEPGGTQPTGPAVSASAPSLVWNNLPQTCQTPQNTKDTKYMLVGQWNCWHKKTLGRFLHFLETNWTSMGSEGLLQPAMCQTRGIVVLLTKDGRTWKESSRCRERQWPLWKLENGMETHGDAFPRIQCAKQNEVGCLGRVWLDHINSQFNCLHHDAGWRGCSCCIDAWKVESCTNKKSLLESRVFLKLIKR